MIKSQQYYVNKFKETYLGYGSSSKVNAYKLIYQWVKTGELKQSTVVELLTLLDEGV